MGFFEIFVIGIGLAMDAFAVSICKGLSIKQITLKCGINLNLILMIMWDQLFLLIFMI